MNNCYVHTDVLKTLYLCLICVCLFNSREATLFPITNLNCLSLETVNVFCCASNPKGKRAVTLQRCQHSSCVVHLFCTKLFPTIFASSCEWLIGFPTKS